MANEITVAASLSLDNGELVIPTYGGAYTDDQSAAAGGVPGYMALTTTEAAISTTGVTTPGWVWMKNVGSNVVIWGKTLAGPTYEEVGRIPAGMAVVFYVGNSVSLFAKCDTGTCGLQVLIIDR